jgi:hypothetical protein
MNADKILSQYGEPVAATGSLLRKFLLKHLPGITEQPDARANLIGYSYGAGYKDLTCTILMSKKGVKLGLYNGGELPDPLHVLTGSGKVHKYVPINSEQDLNNPALLDLLKQALQAHQMRMTGK